VQFSADRGWCYVDRLTTQAITAISADTFSGAAEIAERSADLLLRLGRTDRSSTPDAVQQVVLSTGWELIRAHPTMAPLVNLMNAALERMDGVLSASAARQALETAATDFKRGLRLHEAAISEAALDLIRDDSVVLTNGRSTTVQAALRFAQRAGRRFRVFCAEARPGLEGRIQAAELAAEGLTVTLVIDALAVARVAEVQLVLVGADHLRGQALVNKVGTYAIALAANDQHVPIYPLCSSEKFLPPGYQLPAQAHWPAEQVWGDAPANVMIENLYFDETPLRLLAGSVTEQGVLPNEGIEAWFAAIKLHPALIAYRELT
jgi:translation initiation factor eIF-2B subunit delta